MKCYVAVRLEFHGTTGKASLARGPDGASGNFDIALKLMRPGRRPDATFSPGAGADDYIWLTPPESVTK